MQSSIFGVESIDLAGYSNRIVLTVLAKPVDLNNSCIDSSIDFHLLFYELRSE